MISLVKQFVDKEGYDVKCQEATDTFKKYLEDVLKKTSYILDDVKKIKDNIIEDEYYIACISGGKNGNGIWTDYFENLREAFEVLKEEIEDIWVIQIDNDVLDDIHYVYIGLR